MDFEFDYENNSLEEMKDVRSDVLMRTIGYLKHFAENYYGTYSEKEVELAERILAYIREDLSGVLKHKQ